MPSRLSSIKKVFHQLDQIQQDVLLTKLYNFSQGTREFLESRLLNIIDDGVLIDAMKKETLEKVFHKPMPRVPDGRKVRSIIARARKLRTSDETMMELERLAFEGFVEFLNEYGGEPYSFNDMACDHLRLYLRLAKKCVHEEQYAECINQMRQYLQKKLNICTDLLYDTFETVTGLPV